MKTHFVKLALGVLLIALLGLLSSYFIVMQLYSSTLCQGKPIGYWTNALKSSDSEERAVALAVVVNALQHPNVDVRRIASKHLVASDESLPDQYFEILVKCQSDPDSVVRMNGALLLSMIDIPVGDSIKLLTSSLRDPESAVRMGAVRSLAAMIDKSPAATALMSKTLESDSDPGVRTVVISMFREHHLDISTVYPNYCSLLSDENESVRYSALVLISESDSVPTDCIDTIKLFLNDPSETVRKTAKRIIDKVK